MALLAYLSLLLFVTTNIGKSHAKETGGVRNYKGYQFISVIATTSEQLDALRNVSKSKEVGIDILVKEKLNEKTALIVSPEGVESLKSLVAKYGMKSEVTISDVQKLIDESNVKTLRRHSKSGKDGKKLGWDYFPRYSDIQSFLLQEIHPASIATVEVIGQSYEGRDIHAVKISTSPTNSKSILIDANIHAREWITSATATWIINEFVHNTQEYTDSHLSGIDYYIIPLLNPDGYEYCHTTDRMWRKTRSINPGSPCVGCDPNRNFPFKFGGEETSSNPCSNQYKGPKPLSEKESKALVDFMHKLKDEKKNVKAYLSFHSFGQQWLLPWGYTANTYPEDFQEQQDLGERVKEAISEAGDGTEYEVGSGADVLYGVGGASDDYAKTIGIKYTVTWEMRDLGKYGFLLPPDHIESNAKEVMAGLGKVAEQIRLEE